MSWAIENKDYSQRRACGLVGLEPKTYRYVSTRPDDGAVRQRLRELALERRRFGYRRLHILLRREGIVLNRKKVYRLYREERPDGAQARRTQTGSASTSTCSATLQKPTDHRSMEDRLQHQTATLEPERAHTDGVRSTPPSRGITRTDSPHETRAYRGARQLRHTQNIG